MGSTNFPRTASAAVPEQWPHAAVLVVDDEPGMRHFLEKTLAPRAGQVFAAASAEEAEALLLRHRFDLVILDISMPGKSGIALLQDLRAQGNDCEVVRITAFADLDTAIEALRAGSSDFLLKPFRVTQVLNAFNHGLERARLKRENWILKRALSQRTPGLVFNRRLKPNTDLAIDFHTGTSGLDVAAFHIGDMRIREVKTMMTLYPVRRSGTTLPTLVCCTTPTSMRAFPPLRPRWVWRGGWIST